MQASPPPQEGQGPVLPRVAPSQCEEELCEKPPLKEVGSVGLVYRAGAGVTKARDGATGGGRNGLQRQGQVQEGRKEEGQREGVRMQGRALRTPG